MIVSVPEKDRWCGARGKFVWWKGVRVTKASERANVGVRGWWPPQFETFDCTRAPARTRMQWEMKLPLHSCSLPGSMNATQVSFWGGRLHFREVGEQICKFGKPQEAYLQISL
ncbi:hypothetical protein Tco_1377966 [Tanacetum coccineum]